MLETCAGDGNPLTKSLELLPPVCAAMSASGGITVPQDRLEFEYHGASQRTDYAVEKLFKKCLIL